VHNGVRIGTVQHMLECLEKKWMVIDH